MALKADAQGFLLGDPVDISRAVDQLRGIRSDVAEIKRAVIGASKRSAGNIDSSKSSSAGSNPRSTRNPSSGSQSVPAGSASSSVNKPKLRSSGPELPPLGSGGVLTPASRAENGTMLTKAPSNVFTPTRRKRDASGRFVSVDNSPNEDESKEKKKEKSQQSLLGGFANRIATAVKESAAGTEDVDPTIKAFQEVATPMMRGYDILLGGRDKKEGWYKKIFKELSLFRKDESVFNKAQAKVLKNIEAKPTGGSGNSGGGGFMAMLAGLLGGKGVGGLLGGLVKGLLGGKGVGGLLGGLGKGLLGGKGVGGLMGGLGKGLLGGGKGLLKRIPLLGALIGGLGAASDIFGTESDGSLTRAEKDRRDGKSVGGFAGSLGGMWAGAAAGSFLGPIGTVVGGAVGMFLGDQGGQIIGEKVGEWTTQLREADIPGKIIGAWTATTDAIKSGWDGALKLFSSAWDKTKDLGKEGLDWAADKANAANDLIKEKTGVDVEQNVKDIHKSLVDYTADTVIPSLSDLANKGGDKLKQGAQWVGDNTTVGKGVGYIKGLLQTEGKTRVYEKDDGSKETREGGTVAWRNNNPGNLKFEYAGSADKTVKSKRTKEQALLSAQKAYDGVVDLDQWGNAIFSTEEAGKNAKAKLLTKKHGDKTIEEMLPKYAVSDYSGKADTQAYAAGIHKLAASRGLDLKGKKISDLNPDEFNALMDGMKKVEGFKEGKVSIDKPALASAEIPKVPPSEDPTQGGRYKFENLEGGAVQVTDSQDGTISLASDEQANAYRRQQGKPYKDKLAAINTGNIPLYNNLAGNGPVETNTVQLHDFLTGPGSANPVQIAHAPVPSVPTFSPVPVPADAPPVITPLASSGSGQNVTVTMPTPDVGQDVRDRGIAHIVTGGMSGRG